MSSTSNKGIDLKHFLFEDWGILESELYDCLVLPGREIICDFGAGAQGVAFMAEDGSFVKVTDDVSEAAFASFLRDEPRPEFPRIDDIYSFELGYTRLFAIYREAVNDFLDPFDERDLDTPVIEAMFGAGHSDPPDNTALERLREISPRHYEEIARLLSSVRHMKMRDGFSVSDLHADNIGRTSDGRVVVRDFGDNSLAMDEIVRLVSHIPELPTMRAGATC